MDPQNLTPVMVALQGVFYFSIFAPLFLIFTEPKSHGLSLLVES